MSKQTYRSPQSVAKKLDISPASLRRWSDEFTPYLSKDAGSDKTRSHRRYTEADVLMLQEIKTMMNDGLTYEEVRQQLNGHTVVSVEPDQISGVDDQEALISESDDDYDDDYEEIDDRDDYDGHGKTALVAAGDESPAIAFLNNTLTTLSDTQKSILNSQTANRELLGVLLQDNFNLKEENNRLRERILDVERQVASVRQEEYQNRETLRREIEAKISATNQLAAEAIATARSVEQPPEIKAVERKSGCLGLLLGRGGTQIVTTRRRKDSSRQVPARPAATDDAASHPKPMFPPE